MPTVHIVIPTYKPDTSLTSAVASALAQTDCDVLVTVVDDASPDDTKPLLQNFLHDVRLRYVKLARNSGPSDARNIALLLGAKTDYVTFHDSDDIALPNKIAFQLQQLAAHKEIDPIRADHNAKDLGTSYDIAVNKVIRRERDGTVAITGEMGYLLRDIIPNSYDAFGTSGRKYSLHYPSALFKKSVLSQLGGYFPSLYGYEDNELAVRTMLAGMNYTFSETPLYFFNKNNASITYNTDNEHQKRVQKVYEHIQLMRRDYALPRAEFKAKYQQPIVSNPGLVELHNLDTSDFDTSIPASSEVIAELKQELQNAISIN